MDKAGSLDSGSRPFFFCEKHRVGMMSLKQVAVLAGAVEGVLLGAVFGAALDVGAITDDIYSREKIIALMNKVNDYTYAHPYKEHDRNWVRATYYTGVMALYETTRDAKVLSQAMGWARKHKWLPGDQDAPANKLTCAQTYLQLYFLKKDPAMIAPVRRWVDSGEPGAPSLEGPWYNESGGRSYCDSLYVAPPAFAMLAKATRDARCLDSMNRMYWAITDELFDKDAGLYYRDNRFPTRRTRNDKKIFWSRGNGWVIAGIPRILRYLPEGDPHYKRYLALFRQMADAIAKVQGDDGLWRANLGDADDYPGPESSGTAFFCYGLAWGINNGHLERGKFLPGVRKAWKGLVASVHVSGRLGWVQKIGDRPASAGPNDTHEYAVGAFLLAGSEMAKLAEVVGLNTTARSREMELSLPTLGKVFTVPCLAPSRATGRDPRQS